MSIENKEVVFLRGNMPNISMCKNKKCKDKETCYRYKATPDKDQLYADFTQKYCEYYWPFYIENGGV